MDTITPSSPAPDAIVWNEDCITGMAHRLAPDSIDLCVTSIPFMGLFMYSGKIEDVGNNADSTDCRAGQFGLHMRFFVEQLFRVMKPGHNACIHIQQLLRYKNQHGYIGRRDFRGAVIDLFGAGGLEWIGEFVIPKNPQIIAQRLNLHSLMFATGKRNSRDLAPAVNDYVLVFQKPGETKTPCRALRDAEENPDGWLTSEEWIRDAHGVWKDLDATFAENMQIEGFREAMQWMLKHDWLATGIWPDIQEIDVLDGWKSARETDEERHVCPLQLEVIRRCIKLYTCPGEVVLDPYMGIHSTAWVAMELERASRGFELKESYFSLGQRNLAKKREEMAEAKRDLFSWKEQA